MANIATVLLTNFNKIPAGLGNDDVGELYFCLVQSGELQSRVKGAYRALGLFWP